MAVSPRFGFDDILGNETVDFAVLQSNWDIADQNAAHLGLANVFTNVQTVQRGVATDMARQTRLAGDVNPRFSQDASGTLRWGVGTLATDTNLYRQATGVLRTDGSLQVGGQVATGVGSVGAPAHGFLSDPDSGFYSISNDQVGLALGGVGRQMWSTIGVRYRSDSRIEWSSTTDPTAGQDTNLYRSAAGVLKTDFSLDVVGAAILRGEVRAGGANPGTMAQRMTFPSVIGNKIVLYDNGDGSGFGLGVNNGETVLFGNTIGFRGPLGYNGVRPAYVNTVAGDYFGTTFNGTHVGNIQNGAAQNFSLADGVVHTGWVRNSLGNTGIFNNAVATGIAFDTGGPYFYQGPNSTERFQSRQRADNLRRQNYPAAGATLDLINFDTFYLTTPGNYTLSDITPVYGRRWEIKNVTGGAVNLYVSNGMGIYEANWFNPFPIPQHAGSISIEASAAYGGFQIV